MIHYIHRVVGTPHLTLLLRVTIRRLARLRSSVCVHTNTNRRHAHRGPLHALDEDVSIEMVDWDNMHLHSDGSSNGEAVAAATSAALLPVSAVHFSWSDRLDELRRGCWGGGEWARRRTQWLVDNSAVLQHIH